MARKRPDSIPQKIQDHVYASVEQLHKNGEGRKGFGAGGVHGMNKWDRAETSKLHPI